MWQYSCAIYYLTFECNARAPYTHLTTSFYTTILLGDLSLASILPTFILHLI